MVDGRARHLRHSVMVVLAIGLASCSGQGSAPTAPTATTPGPDPSTTIGQALTTVPKATTSTTPEIVVGPDLPDAATRADIPWDEVGAGWYLALYDSSRANPSGPDDERVGPIVLYLVDGDGNRYQVAWWLEGYRPWWLVDATGTSALIAGNGDTMDEIVFQMVDLTTDLTEPVYTVGFPDASIDLEQMAALTRPTGANIVVHRSDGTDEWLDRISPDGTTIATLYTQPYLDALHALHWMYGHEGTSLLIAHQGAVTEVGNTGTPTGELWSPDSNRCDPVRWWDADTFLAVCYALEPATEPIDDYGNLHSYYGRLWLLETDGSKGVPLTSYPARHPIVVDFGYHDAWPTEEGIYLQWSGDCGASQIHLLQPNGLGEPLEVSLPPPMSSADVAMVDVVGSRIAVHAWNSCDGGPSALLSTDLDGHYLHDLVPVLGDARGVTGVQGMATVFP